VTPAHITSAVAIESDSLFLIICSPCPFLGRFTFCIGLIPGCASRFGASHKGGTPDTPHILRAEGVDTKIHALILPFVMINGNPEF
jgi:hypothetical protein